MTGTSPQPRRRDKKKIVLLILLAALLISTYSFEVTVLPAWAIVVVNENGEPLEGVRVMQNWKHYSYEWGLNNHLEERLSTKNGSVSFPERRVNVSIFTMVWSYLTEHLLWFNIHGSAGMHAYVYANEPNNFETLSYDPGKPLPDKLLLAGRK